METAAASMPLVISQRVHRVSVQSVSGVRRRAESNDTMQPTGWLEIGHELSIVRIEQPQTLIRIVERGPQTIVHEFGRLSSKEWHGLDQTVLFPDTPSVVRCPSLPTAWPRASGPAR